MIEDIKEVQRILLNRGYSVKCIKDIGVWMLNNLETSKDYIKKTEFKEFLKKEQRNGGSS